MTVAPRDRRAAIAAENCDTMTSLTVPSGAKPLAPAATIIVLGTASTFPSSAVSVRPEV